MKCLEGEHCGCDVTVAESVHLAGEVSRDDDGRRLSWRCSMGAKVTLRPSSLTEGVAGKVVTDVVANLATNCATWSVSLVISSVGAEADNAASATRAALITSSRVCAPDCKTCPLTIANRRRLVSVMGTTCAVFCKSVTYESTDSVDFCSRDQSDDAFRHLSMSVSEYLRRNARSNVSKSVVSAGSRDRNQSAA